MMKIGAISKLCNVSKETIRYYITLGLLIPQRKGSSVIFSERDVSDLMYIKKLKKLCFSLSEIQSIISLKKNFYGIEPSYISEIKDILISKRREILFKINELNNSIIEIDVELSNVKINGKVSSFQTGVPINYLSILTCPHCNRSLQINKANIISKYIISGQIVCQCGYKAEIKNGIILTENKCTDIDDHPDVTRELYKGLHPNFLKYYQRASDLITDSLQRASLHKKIIMEANINGYCYLYNNFKKLPEDALYIVTDKYPEMLLMYRNLLERLNINFDVLYIADAKTEYPIQTSSVDYMVDFFGNGQYQLYSKNSFIIDSDKYLKKEAEIIGTYLSFDPNAKSRFKIKQKYQKASNNAYNFPALKSDYEKLGYKIMYDHFGSVFKTQNEFSFDCHIDGEEMKLFHYVAKRDIN